MALQFLILTAARSGEVRGARWSEIDFVLRRWNIPAERMKSGKAHTVPLSDSAISILRERQKLGDKPDELVFEGMKRGRPLSDMTLTKILRDAGLDFTVHGFRSSFRDWTSETTSFSHEVAEMALAHTIRNSSEAAYRRGQLLEKRSRLMADWADYLRSGSNGLTKS